MPTPVVCVCLQVHGPAEVTFGEQLAAISAVAGKTVEFSYLAPDAWAAMLVSFGQSEVRECMHALSDVRACILYALDCCALTS